MLRIGWITIKVEDKTGVPRMNIVDCLLWFRKIYNWMFCVLTINSLIDFT